ncbi:hypothetical protein GCM10020000_26120 [Streptomyces olivoverticillatus]
MSGGGDPVEVIPGKGTSTPSLVDGIREGAKATGSAADAARGHLADKKSRYRIADPGRDLKPVQTVSTGTSETVRLQQKHRGVDVLGGQYVVRMEKKDGKRVVTGTSGKYFTALKADTKADVGEDLAVRRAVAATAAQLGGKRLAKPEQDAKAPALTGTARGLVVLPRGAGVLTQHVTVRGTDPATGEPVLREVYVDAKAGYPVLQYSGIKTFGAPPSPPSPRKRRRRRPRAATRATTPASPTPASSTTAPPSSSACSSTPRAASTSCATTHGCGTPARTSSAPGTPAARTSARRRAAGRTASRSSARRTPPSARTPPRRARSTRTGPPARCTTTTARSTAATASTAAAGRSTPWWA